MSPPHRLRVRFWGTRGSVPSPGSDTIRYGGNTPCLTLQTGDALPLIFDAGTGIRSLGAELGVLAPDARLELFLSHTHLDHIQGLPFFGPLYQSGVRLRVWGADDPPGALERTMRLLMSPPVFPVPIDSAGAALEFHPAPFEGQAFGHATVRALPVHHPGGALGYHIACGDASVVYVPDNELHGGRIPAEGAHEALVAACRGATLLIHDATFTTEESAEFTGWGHSTADDALELALEAEVGTLALFHHAPHRTDAAVDAIVAHCALRAAAAGSRLRVIAAAEGEALEV